MDEVRATESAVEAPSPRAGRWVLPPLGSVLVGGLSLGWGLMSSYFLLGMDGGLSLVFESRLSPTFKGLVVATAIVLLVQVAVGACLLLGLRRRALVLAPLLFLLQVPLQIAQELAGPMPRLAEKLPFLAIPALLAVLAALVAVTARRQRKAPPPQLNWWRLVLLGCEVAGAGFVAAMGGMIWLNVIALHDAEAPEDRRRVELASRRDIPASLFGLTLPSADGRSMPAAPDDGRRGTLVVFWATWCRPCVAELPALTAAASRFEKHGVRVVLINVDVDDPARVLAFLAARGASPERTKLIALLDPQEQVFKPVGDALGQSSLPTAVVLDAKGQPITHWIGARDEQAIVTQTLTALQRVRREQESAGHSAAGR